MWAALQCAVAVAVAAATAAVAFHGKQLQIEWSAVQCSSLTVGCCRQPAAVAIAVAGAVALENFKQVGEWLARCYYELPQT